MLSADTDSAWAIPREKWNQDPTRIEFIAMSQSKVWNMTFQITISKKRYSTKLSRFAEVKRRTVNDISVPLTRHPSSFTESRSWFCDTLSHTLQVKKTVYFLRRLYDSRRQYVQSGSYRSAYGWLCYSASESIYDEHYYTTHKWH